MDMGSTIDYLYRFDALTPLLLGVIWATFGVVVRYVLASTTHVFVC